MLLKDKKNIIILLSIIAVIVIGSVIGIFYVSRPSESNNVEIVSN